MKQLLVLILAVGVAFADIGLTYRVPETSYGVPAYQHNNNAEYNSGYTGSNGYTYKAENSAQAGYQGSSFNQQNVGYQAGYQASGAVGADNSNAGYQTGNYQDYVGTGNQYYQNGGLNSVSQPSYQFSGDASQGGYQSFNHYHTSSDYQSSAVQKYQEYYNQWQQQPAQVFKHFYVHAAPEEPEEPKRRQPVALPPPQKHYKIIFIKAPSQTVYTPQYIPVPQPNEEKTIVYVLVKKPEDQQDIVVPKLEQKAPAKPEVFFIKYNNKDDSSAVINNIVSDYNKVDTVNFASGSGSGSTGQYNTGSGQYQTSTTGQYNQGISGQSNKGSSGQYSQGTYNQYAQKGSTSQSSSGIGQIFGGLPSHGESTADSSAATATTGYTSGVTSGSTTNLSALSTSQGVPHETYGPPKFRV